MSGLISEPNGNAALEAQGSDAYPASVWDSQQPFELTRQLGRAVVGAEARYGAVDEFGQQIIAPEPPVDPASLNAKWGIPGHLTFDNPLPDSVARSMNDAKRDELARQDAVARSSAGMLTRFGAGLITGALDPLNLAAAFVPAIGEARAAGWLAVPAIWPASQ